MKVTALKTFYFDHFGCHLTKGETAEVPQSKNPKNNQLTKRAVGDMIEGGLLKKAADGAKVGKQDVKKGVKILKEAKKNSDKIKAELAKATAKGKAAGKKDSGNAKSVTIVKKDEE